MTSTGEDDRDDSFSKEIVTNNLEIVVDGLVHAASYSVSVIAFVADYEVTRDKHGMTSRGPQNWYPWYPGYQTNC